MLKYPFNAIQIFFALFLLVNTACSKPGTPQDVAAGFWKSIQSMDVNLLYKNVAKDTVKQYKLDDIPPVGKVFLGETVIEEDRAWIETSVEMIDKENLEVPMRTVLVSQGEQWKVDYDATVQSLTLNNEIAELFSHANELGDRFMESFNDVIDEYQKTVPEIERELYRLEENIRSQIPEIKEKLEDFAREIEEAIKNPPPPEPDKPIEI